MLPCFGFISPGLPELLIVGAVILLLFGNRLPSIMRSLGSGIVEFKKGVKGIEDDTDAAAEPKIEAKEKTDEVKKEPEATTEEKVGAVKKEPEATTEEKTGTPKNEDADNSTPK